MPTPTPAKRSRISNSPSFGDTAALIRRQLPPRAPEPSDRRCSSTSENSGKPVNPAAPEAQSSSSPAILTVSSPETVRGEPAAAAAAVQFLDECYLCRKRIPHNSEVFMYGSFGAFCSEACRLQQIYKDRMAEQGLVKSTGNGVGGVKSNNMN